MAYADSEHGNVPAQPIDAARLNAISQELAQIAARLDDDRADLPGVEAPADQEALLLALARDIYTSRRQRARVFDAEALFGEPAWDILLDLFIARFSDKPLSVTAACIGAAVPTSTGLRWLAILEDQGLVRRASDPRDARRVFLHLTETGLERMTTYLLELHAPAPQSQRQPATVLRLVR